MVKQVTDPDVIRQVQEMAATQQGVEDARRDIRQVMDPEVIKQVQEQRIRQAQAEQRPAGRRLAASIAEPFVKAGVGMRELVTPMLPEAIRASEEEATERLRGDVQRLREYGGEGALPTAGRIAGEVGMLAGPATAGLKAGQALARRFPSMRWTAPAAGEAAAMGGYRAAATPGTPQERAVAGATESGAALTGHGVGRALENTLRGVRRAPEAEELLQRDVPLTPGQAAEAPAWKFLESRALFFPGLAGRAAELERTSVKEWNKSVLKQAVARAEQLKARPAAVTKPGIKGVRQAKEQMGKAYDNLYARFDTPQARKALMVAATDIQSRVMQEAQKRLAGDDISRVVNLFAKRAEEFRKTPTRAQEFRQFLEKQVKRAVKNEEDLQEDIYRDALERWDTALEALSPGFKKARAPLDKGYAELATLEDAAELNKARALGYFLPEHTTGATKGKGTLLEREVEIANEVFGAPDKGAVLVGKESPLLQTVASGLGANVLRNAVDAAKAAAATMTGGRVLMTEPMRKAMLGKTAWQQAGKRVLAPTEKRAQMLRSALGRSAAAVSEEDLEED